MNRTVRYLIGVSVSLVLLTGCPFESKQDTTTTPPPNIPTNEPPTASAGENRSVDENSTVTLDASASSDTDGSIDSYSWSQSAGTAAALSATDVATPTFVAPEVSADEVLTFTVTVTDDDGATAQDSVSITVLNVNEPPVADAGSNMIADEMTQVQLDGTASNDSDGNISQFFWLQTAGPDVMLSDASIASPTFAAPAVTVDTTLTFTLTVTDNEGAEGSSSVDVLVVNVNQPPLADAGVDQTVDEQTTVSIDGSGSLDPDGSISTYDWVQTAGTSVTLADASVAQTSFSAPDVEGSEVLTFELNVTDNDGATAADTVDIIVNPISDNMIPLSAMEEQLLLNELYYEFKGKLGDKIWVLGYFGNTQVNADGSGYLVENMLHLDVDEEQPHHSFARLNGTLPPDDWHGNQILVYGEIKDFEVESGEPTSQPTPLINVESYELISEFVQDNSWDNNLLPPDVAPENGAEYSHQSTLDTHSTYNYGAPTTSSAIVLNGTQAQACDRSIILSGGVDGSANYARYRDNVVAKFNKMKELGFSDDQIEVFYNNGGEISVGGNNIVDEKADKQAIMDHLMALAQSMPGSCTLTIFVTDHGTGHKSNYKYRGARPAFTGTEATSGVLYDENSFIFDARAKTYRESDIFVFSRKSWYVRKLETGELRVYLRTGRSWEYRGTNTNSDTIISEAEINIDLDNDGVIESDYGFSAEALEGLLTARYYRSNSWDYDRDGQADVRLRWDEDAKQYVVERRDGDEWKEMGRDTNGDYFIDIIDGGVDWNLDGDKADQIGFHEGINLWGREVLWDDEFAEKLKALAEKGVHTMVEMVSCYSGGFVPNVKDYVENIYTGSSEDTPHFNRRKAGGGYEAVDELTFLANLAGIDTDSWNTAAAAATAADDAKAEAESSTKNIHVHAQTHRFTTNSIYERDGDTDEYLIALDLPDDLVGQIYDYEFIFGLQKPRWSNASFPVGLPDNQLWEAIPGGIRVFSNDPIADNQILRVKADDMVLTEDDEIRIEFTDVNHDRLGYHMVPTGDVEQPAKEISFTSPKACVNHTDHGQSSPSIIEWLFFAEVYDTTPLADISVTVEVTFPNGDTSHFDVVLNSAGKLYLLTQIFSYGDYMLRIVDAKIVPTQEVMEIIGILTFPFTVTSDETNKGECTP